MADLFRSSHRKIARAKKHIAEFQAEVERFFNQENLYEAFADNDPKRPGKDIWKLRLNQPFPETLDEIVGDVVNNLRSALDHACHAAAVVSGLNNPINTYFPFGKTLADFNSQSAARSKNVPVGIRTLIAAYGPHREGNVVLWSLNRIAVRDKHTGLVKVGIRLANSFSGAGGGAVRFPMNPCWDHNRNEVEFAEFTSGTAVHFKLQADPFIAFDEIEVVEGEPVIGVLDYLVDMVQEIVCAIEAESQKLGLRQAR